MQFNESFERFQLGANLETTLCVLIDVMLSVTVYPCIFVSFAEYCFMHCLVLETDNVRGEISILAYNSLVNFHTRSLDETHHMV